MRAFCRRTGGAKRKRSARRLENTSSVCSYSHFPNRKLASARLSNGVLVRKEDGVFSSQTLSAAGLLNRAEPARCWFLTAAPPNRSETEVTPQEIRAQPLVGDKQQRHTRYRA